jgi:dTDP-glucose pyrophosphorylase
VSLGIIPAAGAGTRIQPLAFSKELLPVGARADGAETRPRAVAEYLVERLILGGADRLCFVVAPDKSDIISYFGRQVAGVPICYVVQAHPLGLCDAIFSAAPFRAPDEPAIVGLPDTVWFPKHALRELPDDVLSFVLFPVSRPELFDAVVVDDAGRVRAIEVKSAAATTPWIWGAFKVPGPVLHELECLWHERGRADQLFGTLVNAYVARGGRAVGVRAGRAYVDVGTFDGYRDAVRVLRAEAELETASSQQRPLEETP